MRTTICYFLGIFLFLLSQNVFAQTTSTGQSQGNKISFQGKLEQNGVPPTDTFQMFFTLWGTGWSEPQSVEVRKGLYAVELGSVKPIPDSIFANRKELELEIRVNGQPLEPRVKIYPVPFAYKAQTVEVLSIEGKHIREKTIEAKHLKDGVISANLIKAGSITGNTIAAGTIETTNLKPAGFYGVMATDRNGNVVWLDFSSVSQTVFASATLTQPLSQGRIFIGNEQGLAREQSIFGDISLSSLGFVTIQNSAITSAKIQDFTIQNNDLADNSISNSKIIDGAVNSQKIQDHTILPNDLAFSSADMVLITDTTGKPYWENRNAFASATVSGSILQGGNSFATAVVIGSNDAQRLIFKANGQQAGRIDIAIGTGEANTFYGHRTGNLNNGTQNTFIGYEAGYLNTAGGLNTFVGFRAGQSNTTGNSNTFLGSLAGRANTIGQWNTFLGTQTGIVNTTGSQNTFLGFNAGHLNTTGGSNSFLGYMSGFSNTIGAWNTFSGSSAGSSNTTGSQNTFSGVNAGSANTTGSNNTILGVWAGRTHTTHIDNVIIGTNAGEFITGNVGQGQLNVVIGREAGRGTNGLSTGNSNVMVGYRAGYSNTIGSANTFSGLDAGYSNTTGGSNTFLGFRAGYANTTAHYNTFVGTWTGSSNTTGSWNTFSGYMAGYSNTTGNWNTFSGFQAGYTNTTGSQNTFSGYMAGYSNTTGNNNTFSGFQAGNSNTTGNNNTFLGSRAGYSNTTGAENTFLGYNTGYLNTIGERNTILGNNAGFNLFTTTTFYGSRNVFIGTDAGRGLGNNTGKNNVFVGEWAGRDNTTGFQNTFVGRASGSSNTIGSYNVAIGNSAGSFSQGDNNTFLGESAGNGFSGNYNTLLGMSVGVTNSTGNNNLISGSFAGLSFLTINNSVILGYNAGGTTFPYSTIPATGNVFIGYQAGGNEIGSNKLYIENSSSATPLIYGDFANDIVGVNGRLGINTSNPTNGLLHIIGATGSVALGQHGYLDLNSTGDDPFSAVLSYSIYATGGVAAEVFRAFSDARIKKIKGYSDQHQDLEILNQIKITDYQLVDSIAKGRKTYKKVIAQQVEQIYPQAVDKVQEFVPDIYELTDKLRFDAQNKTLQIGLAKKHSLKKGDKVRFILEEGIKEVAVEQVLDDYTFSVGSWETPRTRIFVYGKEVDDFRNVDYEAISMLNVSATQALYELIQKQQLEITQLKAKLLESSQSQKTELDLLKKQMAQVLQLLGKPESESGKK